MFTTREERSCLFVPAIIWIGGRRIADRARTEKTNDWLCYRRKIQRARTVINREQPGAALVYVCWQAAKVSRRHSAAVDLKKDCHLERSERPVYLRGQLHRSVASLRRQCGLIIADLTDTNSSRSSAQHRATRFRFSPKRQRSS